MLTANKIADNTGFLIPKDLIEGLSSLESHIKSSLNSEAYLLNDIPSYLLSLGGKRIRPLLVFLVARLLKYRDLSSELLNIAAGIELIHMATLLHDDIIDKAPLRRNKESAYRRYGEANTLLAGNFLFVRAFGLCAKLDPFVIQETERACVELTEGEILEGSEIFDLSHSIKIASKKTASLFRLSALSGAFVAKKDKELAMTFGEFGQALGIAFQISDDILDITSTEDILGKAPGTDIRERKPSTVNCLWINNGSALASDIFLRKQPTSFEIIDKAIKEITQSGVIAESRRIGLSYADRANSILDGLRSNSILYEKESYDILSAVIAFAVNRLK